MINTDRIVPVTAVDLISLYGLILKVGSVAVTALDAATENGQFSVTSASGPLLASEPVQSLDLATAVTSASIYFVAAYDFAGFSINGVAQTTTGATINPDGRTLYLATLADSTITISKVGF